MTTDSTPTPMGEAESGIARQGFHAEFLAAIEGLEGPREHLAFVFMSGLSTFAVKVMKPALDEWSEKIRTKNGRYPDREAAQPTMDKNNSNDETETATPLTEAERALLFGFLDELSEHQSNAGCNDIELPNTRANVTLVREVLSHSDYCDDEPWREPARSKPAFYAPCGDHGLLGHLRRKLQGGAS